MKTKLRYIRAVLLTGLVFFLVAFAEKRNSKRSLSEVKVHFTNSDNLYVTEQAVDKLLIQNKVKPESIGKDSLDLNRIESILDAHDMIEYAEVYMSIDGKLGAAITQRKPFARVMGTTPFYIDRQGKKMPLSDSYSARVPLVTGVSEDDLGEVFPLLEYIVKDEFLQKHIIRIHKRPNGFYDLRMRQMDFVISLGTIKNMDKKFSNFKAFYQKAMKDKKLDAYKKVNLRFGNQVVSTKK